MKWSNSRTALSPCAGLPLLFAVLLATARPATGADQAPDAAAASAPQVRLMLVTANDLFADLEFVLKLTTEEEQKQWPTIKETLEIFLDGVDRGQPIRLDLIFGDEALRYVWSLPMQDFDAFRNVNLFGNGIVSREVRGTNKRLFELTKTFEGFLRHSPPYALVAERRTDVPPNHPDPLLAIKPLLEKQYDLALAGENVATSPSDQQARRASFQNTRKELLAAVRRRTGEDPNDFELRKSLFRYQLDELERIYIEGSHLTAGWVTDATKQEGRLDLDLEAIPGTELEGTIEMAGQQPSYFANIEKCANPIYSGRLNHPLDELRKRNFRELISILRAGAKRDINTSSEFTEEETVVRRKVADMVFDILTEGTDAGVVDGFIDVNANPNGKNTLLAGFKTVDGTKVVEIIELIPQTRADQQAALDVDSVGDVRIHKVVISPKRHPNFSDFFGNETLYVGSTKEAVWCAAGENALAELKAAIPKTAAPPAGPVDGPFLDLFIKWGPWIELRHKHSGQKGDLKLRQMARDAFQLGDDTLLLQMFRKDKRIVGHVQASQGILRLAGKIMADFSKENLQ